VHTLPAGDIQITKEMMDEERSIIEQLFLTSLFKTLTQHPDMTATQVIELAERARHAGRADARAPAQRIRRRHGAARGRSAVRHDRCARPPILPPMPPLLREYGGYFDIEDTSPLAMEARMSRRPASTAGPTICINGPAISGDMSILDPLNFDRKPPAI
jgi:hypothetical protein